MAANFDVNDPELQKYIKMVLADQAVYGPKPSAPPRKQGGGLLGLLYALLLITMISVFCIMAAPRAIELYLWAREGMPVAEQPATATSAPLATAAVAKPAQQPPVRVIVQQQPAQQVQEAPTSPPPLPTQAPIIIYVTTQPAEAPPAPPPPPPTAYPTIAGTDGWYGGGGSGWTEADETQAANEAGIAHAAERPATPAPTARPEPTATAALDGWTCNGAACPTPSGWGGGSGSGW